MRIGYISALLAMTAAGCGASDQIGADQPGYLHAELSVVPLRYSLDREGKSVVMEVLADGTVLGKGAPVARIVGQQILSPSGQPLVSVVPDDTVKGARAPAGAHFDSKNRLVTEHATVAILRAEGVGVRGRGPERGDSVRLNDFGQAQVGVQWEGGKRVVLAGFFDHFEWRATREVELLAMLFLMKPDALEHAPPG